MKTVFNYVDLIPAFIIILQTVFLLIGAVVLMRFFRLLQAPYAGMEYSRILLASVILISVIIISLADTQGVVQSVKVFHSYGTGFYKNLFLKYSQFILIVVVGIFLFALLSAAAIRILPGFRSAVDGGEEMPGAILRSVVILSFVVVIYIFTRELIDTITPVFVNFN